MNEALGYYASQFTLSSRFVGRISAVVHHN